MRIGSEWVYITSCRPPTGSIELRFVCGVMRVRDSAMMRAIAAHVYAIGPTVYPTWRVGRGMNHRTYHRRGYLTADICAPVFNCMRYFAGTRAAYFGGGGML